MKKKKSNLYPKRVKAYKKYKAYKEAQISAYSDADGFSCIRVCFF